MKKLIPFVAEMPADLDTPLSIYLKLANTSRSYLLESVVGGERFGRYSIIGLPAKEWVEVYGHKVVHHRHDHDAIEEVADPLTWIDSYFHHIEVESCPLPLRFAGGLVGYFGYETVRFIEPKLAHIQKEDDLLLPDIVLLRSEEIVVFDNVACKIYFIIYAPEDEGQAAKARIEELKARLLLSIRPKQVTFPFMADMHVSPEKEQYLAWVKKAKAYIEAGDIMQVQLSMRLSHPFPAPPLQLYRAIRTLNPSPYLFYFDLGNFHVVGASPEILVRLEGDEITIRPIAGTRKRGKMLEEDRALAEELRNDPKERAEHVMLIDLARNDIGRVAIPGTVKTTEQMVVERYSHVMHLVSHVVGKIKPELHAIDVLRATFPAGTVTGAPKIRAMEIIDELETVKRGIYAGAVGYLGYSGNMDTAIAIRTAVIKDEKLYVQAAAGIVADSVPDLEWEETQNKAMAMIAAAKMVAEGF